MRRYNIRNKSALRGNNNDLANVEATKRNVNNFRGDNRHTIKMRKIGTRFLNGTKTPTDVDAKGKSSIDNTCDAPADRTLANRSNQYEIRVISLNKLKNSVKENMGPRISNFDEQ